MVPSRTGSHSRIQGGRPAKMALRSTLSTQTGRPVHQAKTQAVLSLDSSDRNRGEFGFGWLVKFDVVRVPRADPGPWYGLRLVAESLAEMSAGCTCHATIVAEPCGWQSLKQRDRAPALVNLDRRWRRSASKATLCALMYQGG